MKDLRKSTIALVGKLCKEYIHKEGSERDGRKKEKGKRKLHKDRQEGAHLGMKYELD